MLVAQFADGVEAGVDGGALGQGRDDPLLQEACAHRRDGAVEHGQERAVADAVAQGARQLQAAARHFVQ